MQMFIQASDFVPIVRNLHYVHLCTVMTFLQVAMMESANY